MAFYVDMIKIGIFIILFALVGIKVFQFVKKIKDKLRNKQDSDFEMDYDKI